MIRRICFTALVSAAAGLSGTLCLAQNQSDTLTVYKAFLLAEQNFPLQKKDSLFHQTMQLRLRNLNSRFLPEIRTIGVATYQSDVVELPFSIPGQEKLDLPHERLQAYLDVSQTIYDGGVTRVNKEMERRETGINRQQIEVSLQQLKDQVLSTYFSIILTRQSGDILSNSEELLRQKLQILKDAAEGGVQDELSVLRLEAEIVSLKQKEEEVIQQDKGLIQVLSILTGHEISYNTVFVVPGELSVDTSGGFNRPEIELLSLQQEKLKTVMKLQEAAKRPKIGAFGQGGVGYPNPFNFFDNSFSPYYLVGLRFSWNPWDWGNQRREQQIVAYQSQMLEAEKENLVQNLSVQAERHLEKIAALEGALEQDRAMIMLRQRIRELASLQLDEGLISAGEYIEAVNLEQAVRLNLELHRAQLELAMANYLNQKGTFFNTQIK